MYPGETEQKEQRFGGTWLAQLEENVTLDLGVYTCAVYMYVCIEITYIPIYTNRTEVLKSSKILNSQSMLPHV